MSQTRYCYKGPPSGIELRLADGSTLAVQLHPGNAVELPADHEYTRTLIALRQLEPLPNESDTRRTRPKKESE
ncbi:hypothetical protein [Pseudomonas sp. microsymbiont 2]